MGTMNVSIPDELLIKVDSMIEDRGYASRSEFIRDSLRSFLQELEWASEASGTVLGVVFTTYNTSRRGISDEITRLQHREEDIILTTMHNHMGKSCMELILAKGEVPRIKKLSEELRVIRGMESVKVNIIRPP